MTKILPSTTKLDPQAAARFVKAAHQFKAHISLEKAGYRVNGKSIMGLLELTHRAGSEITLTAEGPDAEQALQVLGEMLAKELQS
ncbi:HPr family phosphocarrier protein [Desulforamulus hydrothermalis]|uniref:HPr-like protein crh n=1 Tax=Desulforamulus hydrothermalis Lam5 = DSM 18033 TaxID=1121428 RepID=K8DXZ9_9FIRM|nr:HPr family phosphocarrier protein [Desulforamulus hydrothermalis]CCO07574.1 HPr-like protein crh [Desulforamulus hydrothermalis Lam5 = DSM 18033]SHH20797.1 phosphocarrier protein [Desulforamulus hydrothermalis Lam5 = DSM 18033]